MARGGRREVPPCCKRYGLPLYCASWVPLDKIPTTSKEKKENEGKKEGTGEEEEGKGRSAEVSAPPKESKLVAVLGGGGGEGRSGVPNALLLSQFDPTSLSLSDQPVCRLGTDGEVPYRMAVHPGGDGFVCSFPKSCRWFEWYFLENTEDHKLALKASRKMLAHSEDAGLQLALAFNAEGSLLATGGEDGHLRIFKWPSLEVILDQSDAHSSVKDLAFSSDAKFLVSLGRGGPCRVWDLASLTVVANLPTENGEVFGFCRFSQSKDNNQILYITAMQGQQVWIVSWNPITWKRVGSKKIVRDPISAFNVSNDGKRIAIGTIEGDIAIFNCDLQVQKLVKKAHLGLVTALDFFQDSRALVSASFDASARVTIIEDKKKIATWLKGTSKWIFIAVLFAIFVYWAKMNGVL